VVEKIAFTQNSDGSRNAMAIYLFLLVAGLVSGALSGVIGTGTSIMLLPLLVYHYGPQQAVPIMTVASLMANIAKMLAWWRAIDWRAFAAYAAAGVPAAALGAHTLLVLPARAVDLALGLFFLAMIPGRHKLARMNVRIGLGSLALAGALIGFLTGIVLSTGPLSVPAFTAYGLVKGGFLATEAAASLALMISKATTFRTFGALPWAAILDGLVIGLSVMIGSFAGKLLMERVSLRMFEHMMDALLLGAGVAMLLDAAR